MRFLEVRLDGPPEVADFYRDLGFESDGGALRFGETQVEFVPGRPGAFHHFALLVPGDRFDAALAWASARVELLAPPDSAEVVFKFDFWNARACYFHDPAGNIAELIAHAGLVKSSKTGGFEPGEIVGLSELMLVGEPAELARRLDLPLWSGDLQGLAFVGEKARTFILARPGRPLLPRGRPAETHRAEAAFEHGGARLRFVHG